LSCRWRCREADCRHRCSQNCRQLTRCETAELPPLPLPGDPALTLGCVECGEVINVVTSKTAVTQPIGEVRHCGMGWLGNFEGGRRIIFSAVGAMAFGLALGQAVGRHTHGDDAEIDSCGCIGGHRSLTMRCQRTGGRFTGRTRNVTGTYTGGMARPVGSGGLTQLARSM
jgi:hypothetical protein